MNKNQQPSFISRFRWLIVGGIGLVLFFIFGSLTLLILDILSTPQYRQSAQDIFENDPTSEIKVAEFATPTPPLNAVPASPTPTEVESIPGREVAYVIQVIDGDTIEVFLNEGTHRLRYIGIDSPEIGKPYVDDATEANRRMVEGQTVELEGDVTNIDQYGRLLRYVYLSDGTFVNAELVKLGFAYAVAYPPDVKFQELLSEAESEAVKAGIGLWTPPEPTAIPIPIVEGDQIFIDPACSQFNAPGNDNENKNEEYICFVNKGEVLVGMTGWNVRDEYGWTYTLPAFSLEPGASVKLRSGCGEDTNQDLYWCKDETAVWNNDGDCVYLTDEKGKTIAEYCY
jgi:micrococcal nuclease